MAYPNGRLPASALTKVQSPDTYLSKPTARAWKRAQAALKKRYPNAAIAHGRQGSGGYRSFGVQDAMRDASVSGRAARSAWGLNPNSSVALAAAGSSSHGMGTALDLSTVVPINDWVLSTMRQYGFTRTFGSSDPNHFGHDGKTATGLIPTGRVYYVIKTGDTLSKIAPKYKTTWQKIAQLNGLKAPYVIYPGRRIRVK